MNLQINRLIDDYQSQVLEAKFNRQSDDHGKEGHF